MVKPEVVTAIAFATFALANVADALLLLSVTLLPSPETIPDIEADGVFNVADVVLSYVVCVLILVSVVVPTIVLVDVTVIPVAMFTLAKVPVPFNVTLSALIMPFSVPVMVAAFVLSYTLLPAAGVLMVKALVLMVPARA